MAAQPNTQLATREQSRQDPFFSESDIKLIRQTVARDATDQEFTYFIRVASMRGLNPLLNQIRLNIYNKNDPNKRQAVIVTTIHGFRLIANRTGRYAPGPKPTWDYEEGGGLLSATAYVRVYHEHSRTWHEYSDTAFWREYNTGKDMWAKMPHLMIAKCAEALALRRGFPEQLTGIYTDDEMAQGEAMEGVETGRPAHNERTGEIIESKAKPDMRVVEAPKQQQLVTSPVGALPVKKDEFLVRVNADRQRAGKIGYDNVFGLESVIKQRMPGFDWSWLNNAARQSEAYTAAMGHERKAERKSAADVVPNYESDEEPTGTEE